MKKFKRAVSPVVTTIFLFGIIMGGIAVSLGIIYPQILNLSDQIETQTAGSTLISLDSDVRSLILNGLDSKLFKVVDLGRTGVMFLDNVSKSTLQLKDGITIVETYNLFYPRIRIQQTVQGDVLSEGETKYLIGSGFQGFIFLNQSLRQTIRWQVVNQTRPLNSENVFTSLSYRHIVSAKRVTDKDNTMVNATVEIQVINMTLSSTSRDHAKGGKPQITLRYKGSVATSTAWRLYNNDFTLRTVTLLSDLGSVNGIEKPVSLERPVDPATKFYVRLVFVYHQLEISF